MDFLIAYGFQEQVLWNFGFKIRVQLFVSVVLLGLLILKIIHAFGGKNTQIIAKYKNAERQFWMSNSPSYISQRQWPSSSFLSFSLAFKTLDFSFTLKHFLSFSYY